MFFIIPLSSGTGVRRLPIITFALIGINILVFMITYPIASAESRRISQVNAKMIKIEIRYYSRNMSNLNASRSGSQMQIVQAMKEIREKIHSGKIKLDPEDEEVYKNLAKKLENLKKNYIFIKFGFTPAKFSFLGLIFSMFLHGGFFHILGNMWFLWFVGCNVEDDWGRPAFLGFYLLSGIVANLIFKVGFPHLNVPLIGASGAIAGVMGAFTFKHFMSKVVLGYMFIIFIRPIFGTFKVFAGVILGLWFLEQIFYARYFGGSGVAYLAHIGGFLFGLVLGAIMKYTGIEEKYIAPKIDKEIDFVDSKFRKGIELRAQGKTDEAIYALTEHLKEHPSDFVAYKELVEIYQSKGDTVKLKESLRKAFSILKKTGDALVGIQFYNDYIKKLGMQDVLKPMDFIDISDMMIKLNDSEGAESILATAYKQYNQADEAPKILIKLINLLIKLNDYSVARGAIQELNTRFPQYRAYAEDMMRKITGEQGFEPR